jgi:ACS family hexuronate transporter-like MFS transporter
MGKSWLRWAAVGVFVLSTALNYLDRQLLAALAPTLKSVFQLSNAQYGEIVSVFSIVYAVMAPVAGWLIDGLGLTLIITFSMAAWSLAGIATGLTRTFSGLLGCRTVLGVAEAAGIPCSGKVNGLYLAPRELALGTAFNQVGITIGSMAAPLIVAVMAPRYGWRWTFTVCGALGFLWIPLWWITARNIPPAAMQRPSNAPRSRIREVLRDRRIWGLAVANMLVMTLYTLWTNWTTIYFVQQHHLTEAQANREFAWIPPIFATLGGLFGGWLAYRAIRGGSSVLSARMRVCWTAGVLLLGTAAVPLMPSALLAAAAISASFFFCLSISTNLYAMPIDFFGVERAAFSVSILTCSYGLMQTFLSPLIGLMVDRLGFPMVCVALSALPLAGIAILRAVTR